MYKDYEEFKKLGFKVNMSRGKPSSEQLDLSIDMIKGSVSFNPIASDGIDCRNYGGLLGLPEARELFGTLLEVPADQVVVAGNSSLALMHDAVVFGLLYGTPGNPPLLSGGPVTFLCPVPGYDRHFAICESLGIRMVSVALLTDGPDMDQVERLVAQDASIKGMWCMPKYSNPSGIVYTPDIIRRLASMPSAAPDFRLFWDDAYRFHHLTEHRITTPNIIELCRNSGYPDRAIVFASTSKITFAGAGVAALASSLTNIEWWQRRVSVRTVGPDKLNQLRHVRFLRDLAGVERLMEQHRSLLKPRFDAVHAVFTSYLDNIEEVGWTRPLGGYFIDLVTPHGLAKRTVELARAAGITLTPAGASFPYGTDPDDRHIRIAPTHPSLEDVQLAADGISLSLLHAIREKSQ